MASHPDRKHGTCTMRPDTPAFVARDTNSKAAEAPAKQCPDAEKVLAQLSHDTKAPHKDTSTRKSGHILRALTSGLGGTYERIAVRHATVRKRAKEEMRLWIRTMPQGSVLNERYVVVGHLVKILVDPAYAAQEIKALTTVAAIDRHGVQPIVRLVDTFRIDKTWALVFEHGGATLHQIMCQQVFGHWTIHDIATVGQELLKALHFLHTDRVNLVHLDVKPENILLSHVMQLAPGTIRLIDFGCAQAPESTAPGYMQSRFYRAPEVMMRNPAGKAADIWSLGCVLAEIVIGSPLFAGVNEYEMLAIIQAVLGPLESALVNESGAGHKYFRVNGSRTTFVPGAPLSPAARHCISRGQGLLRQVLYGMHLRRCMRMMPPTLIHTFVDLLSCMLQPNPQRRWTAAMCLVHPFFASVTVLQELRSGAQS